VHDRGGQLHALLVPVGELLQTRVRPVAQVEALEPAGGSLRRRFLTHPGQLGEVPELLTHLHLRIEAGFLRHVAEPGALLVDEVARSFMVSEQAMAKRLVRAKYNIKAAKIPYRVLTRPTCLLG
jgi:hypothetical protein